MIGGALVTGALNDVLGWRHTPDATNSRTAATPTPAQTHAKD